MSRSLELLSPEEMRAADRMAMQGGTPGYDLMEAAGRAVARAVAAQARNGHVLVVAGSGNNGGDGLVAARWLAQSGRTVKVWLLGDPANLVGDAATALQRLGDQPARIAEESDLAVLADDLAGAGAVVDALFGAGLSRPVEGLAAATIAAVNASGLPVVAVDLPSGIDGLSGRVLGTAVRATVTVTFFRRKPGHLLLPGRLHCGRTEVADIGIVASVLDAIRPRCFANEPALWRAAFPTPAPDGHKYSRGHAVVLSGGLTATGAARLAARGALRAGAGLVTIASPREALVVHGAANEAVMVRSCDSARELGALLSDRRYNAVLIGPGCGVGEHTRSLVHAATESGARLVLDADALTSFSGDKEALHGAAILTPHEGEFSRLFNEISDLSTAKHEKVLWAAGESGCVVLLKGADTVVASPDGRTAIAENAPPWLATAGSGDVLAGMATALLAQGMPAFEAAAAAVWMHGEAAAAFGPGLISEDLPDQLPGVFRRLFANGGAL